MEKETTQIFSSTGSLGVTRRQDNRVYINPEAYSRDPQDVRTLSRLAGIVERNPQRASRGVFRGAVSNEIFQEISKNGLHDRLEVAFPLEEFSGDSNAWLIYWAHNHATRSQLTSTEKMIEETSKYREAGLTPLERIQKVKERGYRFVNEIDDDRVSQVQSLWGPTFGWELQEVKALQQRLVDDSQKSPSERSVWFSSIRDNGTIISMATAERLTIPGPNGDINLVESTEWKTRDDYSNQGLMTATLVDLNAQILHDLQDSGNSLPIIYAECNFQSRSDRAGHGAGYVIPERKYAPQIIKQNVSVGDGLDIPQSDLRDFTYVYLSAESIQKNYDRVQRDAILKEV